jgi:CheY-like chemotaxis protein
VIPILYIDEEANSEAMASKFDMMATCEIEVRPIVNVADALPALRLQKDIALVVLDIIMPPLDAYTLEETNGGTRTGLRLLEDIRREFPRVPLVIVSVMPREIADSSIRLYAVADYITKPVNGSQLSECVLRVLGRWK